MNFPNVPIVDIRVTHPQLVAQLNRLTIAQLEEVFFRLNYRLGVPFDETKKILVQPQFNQQRSAYLNLIVGTIGATLGTDPVIGATIIPYLENLLKAYGNT